MCYLYKYATDERTHKKEMNKLKSKGGNKYE